MIYIYTEKYTTRFKYIVHHIFERMLSSEVTILRKREEADKCEGPLICYSRTETIEKAFNICPHGLIFQEGIRDQEISVTEWNKTKIFFATGDASYDLPFDIFSAIFFLLSRYEEYYGSVDAKGRFKKEDSIAYKYGFLDRPIVDEWVIMLEELLAAKTGYIPTADKRLYRVHSSVVIDTLFKYRYSSLILGLGNLIGKFFSGNFRGFKHQIAVMLYLNADPYDNIEKILKFHNNTNLSPSFFVNVKRGQSDCYNIYTTFRSLRKALRRNYITGLHTSSAMGDNVKKVRRELKTLEKRIVKQRVTTSLFHNLLFSLPKSYETLLKIGVTEDYSMGYCDAIGFRAGTCTPFRFYDIKHETKTRLMIHPLIISAVALKTMGVGHDNIDVVSMPIINRVKAVSGQLCMCMTNQVLSSSGKWYGWDAVLERLYRYASKLEVADVQQAKNSIL